MVCFWAARDGVRSGPRTAQGTDGHGWVGHADWRPALGSGIVSGGASTRQSPLVHCELCVVCGVWCVVRGARAWQLGSSLMSPASSIRKMQKLLMNIYKLISSLCESMQYLTHSRFCSFRLSSINSSPFAGAAASHQNVSDRKAREQHPGICDKCYTLHGNHAAFRQGPDEGRSTRLMAFPPAEF